jgi:hypothetical protein
MIINTDCGHQPERRDMEPIPFMIPIKLQPVWSGRADSASPRESLNPISFYGNDLAWRIAQTALLLAGMLLLGMLLFRPVIGLLIMWNMLIPAAPALLVVAPGVWRNVCPLATMSMLPRRLSFSRKIALPRQWASWLALIGVIALYLIVPLRHINLDTNAQMTAILLIGAGTIAVAMGGIFDQRSGWCTTLCPIHPVEKLYGFAPPATVKNMRCDACTACTGPCPDSTRSMTPIITRSSRLDQWIGHGLTGSFAGFVFGWYQLPDFQGHIDAAKIITGYLWPLGCAAASLAIYAACHQWLCRSKSSRTTLVKVFATAAVCTYYWHRIPALAGFGPYPGTGLLYDLSNVLPGWVVIFVQVTVTGFFVWFMMLRPKTDVSWTKRPAFDKGLKTRTLIKR